MFRIHNSFRKQNISTSHYKNTDGRKNNNPTARVTDFNRNVWKTRDVVLIRIVKTTCAVQKNFALARLFLLYTLQLTYYEENSTTGNLKCCTFIMMKVGALTPTTFSVLICLENFPDHEQSSGSGVTESHSIAGE